MVKMSKHLLSRPIGDVVCGWCAGSYFQGDFNQRINQGISESGLPRPGACLSTPKLSGGAY